jgi:hypothetical protein
MNAVMGRTGVSVAVWAMLVSACGSGPSGDTVTDGSVALQDASNADGKQADASSGSPGSVAPNPQHALGDAADPDACVAAGGRCVQGVGFCANVGLGATPGSCQDVEHPSVLCCAANEDAGCTEIQASNYDQSCATDSDCIRVNVGNPCAVCVFQCFTTVGAINVGAVSQYMSDVSMTPEAFAGVCNCPQAAPGNGALCCLGGQCRAGSECNSPGDGVTAPDAATLDAPAGG